MKIIQVENSIQLPIINSILKANWIKWCIILSNYDVHIRSLKKKKVIEAE